MENNNTLYLVGISAWTPSLQDGSPNAYNFPEYIFNAQEEEKAREAYSSLAEKCEDCDKAYLVKWDMLTNKHKLLDGRL